MITIKIPLPPTTWLSPKQSRRGCYDPRSAEKRAISYLVAQQYNGPLLTEYTVLELLYHFKPPSSASKKRKSLMLKGEIIPTAKDCTNMQKLYEDCLKKIVIDDDRNVAKIISQKLYAEKDEVIINIWTLKEFKNAHHH